MKYPLYILLAFAGLCNALFTYGQNVTELVDKVKAKLEQVNDYTATGVLKTDVAFIKAPISKVLVYYKKPNRFRLVKSGGISVLPKGGISVSMSTIIGTTDYTALDAGEAMIHKTKTRVVKLLPNDEDNNIVLSTLYIDEKNLLIYKAVTTTKENGTYELTMLYGKYAAYGLPDKVQFSFNAKDYKLPKGVTLEFNNAVPQDEAAKLRNKKGRVQINYSAYTINKGIDDAVFK